MNCTCNPFVSSFYIDLYAIPFEKKNNKKINKQTHTIIHDKSRTFPLFPCNTSLWFFFLVPSYTIMTNIMIMLMYECIAITHAKFLISILHPMTLTTIILLMMINALPYCTQNLASLYISVSS